MPKPRKIYVVKSRINNKFWRARNTRNMLSEAQMYTDDINKALQYTSLYHLSLSFIFRFLPPESVEIYECDLVPTEIKVAREKLENYAIPNIT